MSRLYYVWSIEHDAWWRPNEMGYTTDVREAGQYTEEKSLAILIHANRREFNECRIPVECVQSPEVVR